MERIDEDVFAGEDDRMMIRLVALGAASISAAGQQLSTKKLLKRAKQMEVYVLSGE